MKRKLVYEDISPTAAAAASASGTYMKDCSTPDKLFKDIVFSPVQTCEHNYTVLNGKHGEFMKERNYAFWSRIVTDNTCKFSEPITLNISFGGNLQSSVGISFVFDIYGNTFSDKLNIKWYRSDSLLDEADFFPDSSDYACIREVRNYDRLVCTFHSLNRQGRYLKIQSIRFGIIRVFNENEIENIEVCEVIDTSGITVPIGTMTCTVNTLDTVAFLFQKRQPITVFYDEISMGSFFADKWEKYAKGRFKLENLSRVGVLDSQSKFMGGIYSGEKAGDIIKLITANDNIVEINTTIANTGLFGWIPICSRREALAQIAVAAGAIIDTSRGSKIRFLPLPLEGSARIGSDRVYKNPREHSDFPCTGVTVTQHTYSQGGEERELFRAVISGETIVEFREPVYGLTIQNGTILNTFPNYAVITGNAEVILRGKPYIDSTQLCERHNPMTLQNDQTKIQNFANLYLVGSHNVAAVLDRLYNHCIKSREIDAEIILDSERVSDFVYITLPENDEAYGQIKRLALAFGDKRIKAAAVILCE